MKASPSDHTVANYVEYLEDAFLFSEAKRWDVKGRRYLDYPLKYYSEDPGLRNARLGFRDVEPSHMLENVIFNELCARGCQVDVGVVNIGDRHHEIDFVVNRVPEKLYIQVALELSTDEKRQQELLPLRKSGEFFRKMLIVDGYDPARRGAGHSRRQVEIYDRHCAKEPLRREVVAAVAADDATVRPYAFQNGRDFLVRHANRRY